MKSTALTVMLLAGLGAGCSQTAATDAGGDASPRMAASSRGPTTASAEQRCEDAIREAMRQRQGAAMAGSILSSVGGLGGLAGRGGMIAGQAAAIGGSIVQSQAAGGGNRVMVEECS